MRNPTPGPWHDEHIGSNDSGKLMNVYPDGDDPYPVAEYVYERDAALIAAAPDLLYAAEFALGLLDELESGGAENFHEQKLLREAIARAKGAPVASEA